MTRKYTKQLLEMIEAGALDKNMVIIAFCKYMSEDDVKDMMECNEFVYTAGEDNE